METKKRIAVSNPLFEILRSKDCIYVDKTEYIYNLVNDEVNFYYSVFRPRRFGKSLLCSTLQALFEGKRELFRGLYIDSTDYSFEEYPVLHFDFSNINTETYEDFLNGFQNRLYREAKRNGVRVSKAKPSEMLYSILMELEKKAVIIVDEYDYPILHTYKDEKRSERIRETLSAFYSVIKSSIADIRFFFVTGITKFSNLSIFSQMNNLTDLTMKEDYAALFGYTEKELEAYFSDYIDAYMSRSDREYDSRSAFLEDVRNFYDGYRFSQRNDVRVYNPVSVGTFFADGCTFDSYWIDTGASTLAVELARDYHLQNMITDNPVIGVDDIKTFDYSHLRKKSLSNSQVLALIYFTGYLTMLDGDSDALTLTFPNTEVQMAFSRALVKLFTGMEASIFATMAVRAVKSGKIDEVANVLNAYLKEYMYDGLDTGEKGYQEAFFSFFLMIGGIRVSVEDRTLLGRSDVVVRTARVVYIIEMKVDESADKALAQIREKEYYARYVNTEKEVHLIGLNFSSATRNIEDWKEEILDKTKIKTYLLG